MSASRTESTQPNATTIPAAAAAFNPDMTSLDPDAPYRHAPPKDGDPWMTLLAPELEADNLRCNAWKEEVQNLLIFAGLFSAVVTAFVIESYKFLQPDSNNAIIGLLFQIASASNNSIPFPPSVNPESILTPFSQSSSFVRINVFWFLSLILSLTTVLVGTIALQWLREHQSYVGYSGKEKVAILHMRKQAAEAWYLPQVFTALPLLLQGALVLFLAGLIDFSLPLGPKFTIPVSIVVGLTLLFLAATAVLPSLQALSFLCQLYPRKTLPIPCPFKSPQSHALRTLLGIILRATVFYIYPPPKLRFDLSVWQWVIKNPSFLVADHLAPSVYNLWYRQTWLDFDREWLSLRDACHQRILDKDADLYQHRTRWEDSFPLSDVTQYLVDVVSQTPGAKHSDSFLAAIIHCFQELSESIWTTIRPRDDFQRKDRRNNYFEQLHWNPPCSMSKFILHGGVYKFDRFREDQYELHKCVEPKIMQRLLRDDQTVFCLGMLLKKHNSPAFMQYQRELWSRILQFGIHTAPLTPAVTDGSSFLVPTIMEENTLHSLLPYYRSSDEVFSASAMVLGALMKAATSHLISQDRSMHALCAHPQMVKILDILASLTDKYFRLNIKGRLQGIDDQFIEVFEFIGDHLNKKLSDSSLHAKDISLDVIFYLSSVYVWELLDWTTHQEALENRDSKFGQALRSLLGTLHTTWASGRKNQLIERRFKGHRGDRFTEDWWYHLFKHVTGLRVIKQGHSSEQNHLNSRPVTSLQLVIPPENTTGPFTTNLPPIKSSGVTDRPPGSNMQVQDGGMNVQPIIFHSRPSSDEPGATRSFSDDHPSAEVIVNCSHLLPRTVDHAIAMVQQATTMGPARYSDEHDAALHPGHPHLTTGVEAPTILERVESEMPVYSEESQDVKEARSEDAVVGIEYPI